MANQARPQPVSLFSVRLLVQHFVNGQQQMAMLEKDNNIASKLAIEIHSLYKFRPASN